MYEEALEFLKSNRSLLRENKFIELQERCPRRLWGEVYDIFINNDINPLEDIDKIPGYFIQNVSGISKLTIPRNINKIHTYAISNNPMMTSIWIENPNIKLSPSCMVILPKLQSLNFPNGMVSIPNLDLSGVQSLRIIRIPETVTRISAGAFDNIPEDCVIVTPYRDAANKKLNVSEVEIDFYKKHLRFTHAPKNVEVEDEI